MSSSIAFHINGREVRLDTPDGATPLLYALRNDLGLNGPKFGCGLAQCGACTVLLDGVATRACVMPLAAVRGRQVTTLEGLSDGERLHPVQQAFVDRQAMQCGYCSNGMIMTLAALFAREPDASRDDIVSELNGNLCRCGAHVEILDAAEHARTLLKERAQ
ncbi:(2Fe-2S)-binding protein [Burkholderia sp. FERM BP-3421]|uniref:(2Fe-2S)-binding protein n=1 Tax=Burkholderia sp. FERM BP-3421 TaxID=1494466 RepID=UPI002361455E|nr:(2Fe-2S)-binding protein [Burkholderia sp. FERM BP-3421]WDD92380.1 (2Fe-2S)-binding protein [Burkholderia sp. FERM BP-3421]